MGRVVVNQKQGPCVSFEGYLPVEMRIKTVEEARADISEHAKSFPGDHMRCWDEGRIDERRVWLVRQEELETALELALLYDGVPRQERPDVANPREGERKPRPYDRKSAADFVDMMNSRLREMRSEEPGSPRWESLRKAALSARSSAMARAAEDHERIPPVPKIPTLQEAVARTRNVRRGGRNCRRAKA